MSMQLEDRGDKWSDMYRGLNNHSPEARTFFTLLNFYVLKFNKIYFRDKPHFSVIAFETGRAEKRQARLVKGGRSWVANVKTAPHPEGRAGDYVVWNDRKMNPRDPEWIWDIAAIEELWLFLRQNFPLFYMIRAKIIKDEWHIELLRKYVPLFTDLSPDTLAKDLGVVDFDINYARGIYG